MRAQASNTYRSNWQPRDASEVTLRKAQMSQKNNSSTHHGPETNCCLPKRATSPTGGFSTTYEAGIVANKKAGCVQCADPNFGKAGGVQLLNCAEVATILERQPNPVKGNRCYCADPGITQQPFPTDCSRVVPAYTGFLNQVPIPADQQFGHQPSKRQQYPYPSG